MNTALRALLVASCFPHPRNPLLGVWAHSQAEALLRAGVDLEVLSPTSYVPAWLGGLGVAPWAAQCPAAAAVGSFMVKYPRWPVYHAGAMRMVTRRYPSPALGLGWKMLRKPLLDAIERHKPDVIFAHHTFEGGEVARRVKLETGLNYVIADWDFDEITDCRRFPRRFAHYARILDGASAVIATSERMKVELTSLFPDVRVKVAHYGREPLPEQLLRAPRPADRSGKVIVLCACSFYARKGVPVLIEAFARVARDFPSAELWIAGDGPDREMVRKALAQSGSAAIRLLGLLPHECLMQEMAWADVFALVGWDEPFATVYVEALAAGKPIICCNDGGICDVLEHGVQGLTVFPKDVAATADALRQLLSDSALREKMSAASTKLFQARLTTSNYAEKVVHELERAAGRTPSSASET